MASGTRGLRSALRGVMWQEGGTAVDAPRPGPVLRSWWGATAAEDADAYGRYLALTGMMAFRRAPGCRGGWTLRRVDGDRADFLVLSLWDSLDAVRGFAGEDTERAVFYPEDERYLVARDERVEHWEVVQGGTFGGAPTGSGETAAAHPG
jgi:heme-degrading monooxygenase HmoA